MTTVLYETSKLNKVQLLLLLLLLAQVTYNQVQPLRINYLATEFLPKLELASYIAKLFYIHYSIDSVQHKNCINS